jgi:uncharacterized protein (DUF488 family)
MTIYTLGHSNTTIDRFLDLLRRHQIQVLVDTRSQPYSRYVPQFNRESLQASLEHAGVKYLYMGDSLGGRPSDQTYYDPDGKVNYDRLAEAPFYLEGLKRLKEAAENTRLVVLCSEADYRKCHRYRLITRSLVAEGIEVKHLLHSGEVEDANPEVFSQPSEQLSLF